MPYIKTGSGFGDAEPLDEYDICDGCHEVHMADDLTEYNGLWLCGECEEQTRKAGA